MKSKTLVIPLYCPNCDNLVYLAKKDSQKADLIDYNLDEWATHPCSLAKSSIWNEPVITERQDLHWGLDRIPFSPRTTQRSLKSKNVVFGVISSIYEMDKHCNLRVFTNDQVLIDVKTPEPRSALSAGMLLDLSGLMRVGQGKYRLRNFKQVELPNPILPVSIIPEIYLELLLSTGDQGLLETFTKRFLQFFLEKGTAAFIVKPLPLSVSGGEIEHSRSICFRPVPGLMESFKDISLPTSVKISITEIKKK